MQLSIEIEKLSKEEKLQLMHAIWEDLVKDEKQIKSPKWHEGLLRETEERVRSGIEPRVDWTDAKQELRKHFE
ncbi:MAG: addiction module protein [Balneolaceae bacterium]